MIVGTNAVISLEGVGDGLRTVIQQIMKNLRFVVIEKAGENFNGVLVTNNRETALSCLENEKSEVVFIVTDLDDPYKALEEARQEFRQHGRVSVCSPAKFRETISPLAPNKFSNRN